jgi:TonB family protein
MRKVLTIFIVVLAFSPVYAQSRDSSQEEAERRVHEFWRPYVAYCNGSYYMKRNGGRRIVELRGFFIKVNVHRLTEADRLNGVEIKGGAVIGAVANRNYINSRWSEWDNGLDERDMGTNAVRFIKKNGQWDIWGDQFDYFINPISCSDLPWIQPEETKPNPRNGLTLIVEIEGNGRILLNQEETGELNNLSVLTERLAKVFDARNRQNVPGKTVWIVSSPLIKPGQVKGVVDAIRSTGASPIKRLTVEAYKEYLVGGGADPRARSGAPISGGVLNGKAISLPKPPYPPIARAARASGTVTVQVTIDESGKVISARAIGGHPDLQEAAVKAAYEARFAPTMLSGQPVKVTGVLTYNFVR